MIKKNIWNFFFILSIFGLDRVSKIVMAYYSEVYGYSNFLITNFLSFNLIWNDGIAFGLLSFNETIYYNSLTGVICLVTLIVLWMIFKTKERERLAFMMVFGGSLGNIFDRLYYSSVPDFIDIHFGDFHWFIFNVADIFITLGVLLLIYLELIPKKKI
tara:strand:- start:191 stop:664 length:474 start_codon:yes stop_codon:yes gene_type:complete